MEQEFNYPGWEVVREIGTGSYGKVYEIKKSSDFASTENSALKVISIPPKNLDIQSYSEEMGLDEESFSAMVRNQMESITKEFSLMSQLKGNSNIVSYEDHNVVEHKGEPGWDIYIRMELLTPLTNYLRDNNFEKDKSVDESFVARLGTDICKALTICENHHIVHRDIKPQNIFINKDGNFKLGDFGIAKNAENVAIGTRTGTFNYMAPEIYNNQPYGNSVDIYSLGLVMYWLLNERRGPFLPMYPDVPTKSDVDQAMLRRIRGEAIPAPKNGSPAIKKIILKAIQADPQRRYISAAEMLKDLTDNYENGVLKTASVPAPAPTPISMPMPIPVPVQAVNNTKLKTSKKAKQNVKPVDKKKNKKKIIIGVSIASVALIICAVLAIVGIMMLNSSNTTTDDTIVAVPSEVLLGYHEADYYDYKDDTEIECIEQVIKVPAFPKAIEMTLDYSNVLMMLFVDQYGKDFWVYGEAYIDGDSLQVYSCDPIEDIEARYDNVLRLNQTVYYKIYVATNGDIKLIIDDNYKTCGYSSRSNAEDDVFALKGSTNGNMLKLKNEELYIKSINIQYYYDGSEDQVCQIIFSDGSYTYDAHVAKKDDSIIDGYISIEWDNVVKEYNGREVIANESGYLYFNFVDNSPYGFTIIDSNDFYIYQDGDPDYIEYNEDIDDEVIEDDEYVEDAYSVG